MLAIKNLQKAFSLSDGSQLPVLLGLDLTVGPNEIVSVLGPSGCGKTTLLRILAGLEPPSAGQILWNDTLPSQSPDVSMVFQDYSRTLLPWLRVDQQLRLPLRSLMAGARTEDDARIDELLRITKLHPYRRFLPRELSGGMQQRVALARAILVNPKILLLDEPFGSLDALTRYELEDHFLELRQRIGFAAIVVTHDVDEAIYLGDRVVVLSPRPASIERCLEVNIEAPRDQLRTRSAERFRQLRREVLESLEINLRETRDDSPD